MPTLAGFWEGRDIEVKREIGILESDDELHRLRRQRGADRRAVIERLVEEGVLPRPAEKLDPAELRGAIHAFLCRTPAALVGLSLDDLVGEVEPVNVPGATADRFASWTRKLELPLERMPADPAVRAALGCANRATTAGG
jgi:4-alpha-glucanotransferase